MSIESGRYVRIEDNGQQNDSGGVGRTRIQDKIRQPSCFLAYGEQVSGWALFSFYAPIFAYRCISRLHRCITKLDNAPILHPRLQNAPTDAPTAHPCTYGRTHDAPICTYGCTYGTHRINSYALRNETPFGDESAGYGQRKAKNDSYRISTLFNSGLKIKCKNTRFAPIELDYFVDDYKYDKRVYALGNNCNVEYNRETLEIQTTHVPVYIQKRLITNNAPAAKFDDLINKPVDTLQHIHKEMIRELEKWKTDFSSSY